MLIDGLTYQFVHVLLYSPYLDLFGKLEIKWIKKRIKNWANQMKESLPGLPAFHLSTFFIVMGQPLSNFMVILLKIECPKKALRAKNQPAKWINGHSKLWTKKEAVSCCSSSTSSCWRLRRSGSWKWWDLEYSGFYYCMFRTCRCMVSGNVNEHK